MRALARLAVCLTALGSAAVGQDITVVIFTSTICPVSNNYNLRMKELYRDYASKGVKFKFLNANQNESQTEVDEHARRVGFPSSVSKDMNNVMADRLGAKYTPEAFVIDRAGSVRYHGRIDDAQNRARVRESSLRLAIDAVLAGGDVVS